MHDDYRYTGGQLPKTSTNQRLTPDKLEEINDDLVWRGRFQKNSNDDTAKDDTKPPKD
jgi:hypothetical protein